ncbi:3'(2'),5'-bisphosphate nucleotidase CysQ family protein [Campylobacter devanensis]|uniref:3'(2'),5'-bisphosphate nucleotidase CysQ family protein n=1 Tax=Campylobacter devanensis TaxID=3161138 RepID=UPI001EF03A4E|nr:MULTISPECIES: 3'(2'),5'-bisphosphate nucleotidase CysQ [unclassified Campylobacter]
MLDQHLNLSKLHDIAISAALAAGEAILAVYDKFELSLKSDSSPLTTADLVANQAIFTHLQSTQIPICSEESILPFHMRNEDALFWLVDPLDGTKEFIARNGEFCVCIALIWHSRPILGVIYTPLSKEIYSSFVGAPVFRNFEKIGEYKENLQSLNLANNTLNLDGSNILISGRSADMTQIENFAKEFNLNLATLGSAIKFSKLASQEVGVFIRFYGSHIWDTAAGDFLLYQSGGIMLSLSTLKPLNYAKKMTLNDSFIALSRSQKSNLKRYLEYIKLQII